MKDKVDPKYYNNVDAFLPFFNMIYSSKATYKDVLRTLKPYESNKKCLRSIKYNPKRNS